jgi:hypothetical protein
VSITVFQYSWECSAAGAANGTGVVHQNIDRPEGAYCFVNDAGTDGGIAYVSGDGDGLRPCFPDFINRRGRYGVPPVQCHIGARLRERNSHACAETLGRAGDQCIFALQAETIEDRHRQAPCVLMKSFQATSACLLRVDPDQQA